MNFVMRGFYFLHTRISNCKIILIPVVESGLYNVIFILNFMNQKIFTTNVFIVMLSWSVNWEYYIHNVVI